MELQLSNFMTYRDYNIRFDKSLTLLKGPSGSGKTTIFEAIFWCLYGSIRGIDPWYNSTAKTSVKIKIGNYEIERFKRPDRLYLYDIESDIQYEDKIAQEIINEVFLSEKTWICSSYIDEDFSNILFSFSSKIRQSIINDIIFSNNGEHNDPEADVEILASEMKSYKSKAKEAKLLLDNEKKRFLNWEKQNERQLLFHTERSKDDQRYFEKESDLQDSIQKQKIQLSELNQKQGVSNFKKEKYLSILKEIEKFSDLKESKGLKELKDLKELKEQYERFQKMKKIRSDPNFNETPPTLSFEKEDIQKYRNSRSEYECFVQICKKYSISVSNLEEWESIQSGIFSKIKNVKVDLLPLIRRKKYLEEEMKKISCEDSEYDFTSQDFLTALGYERKMCLIQNISKDMNKEDVYRIYEEMKYYGQIEKKNQLKELLKTLPNEKAEEFNEEDYYKAKQNERNLELLTHRCITPDYFRDIEKIKSLQKVLSLCKNRDKKYTQNDYDNLKDYQFYSKIFNEKDHVNLNQKIDDAIVYLQYEELINNFDILTSEDVSEEDYLSVLNEYENMKNVNDTMICPHCKGDVFLDRGQLKASPKKFTSAEKESLKQKLSLIKKLYTDTLKRNELKKKFPCFSENPDSILKKIKNVSYISRYNLSEFRKQNYEDIPVITEVERNVSLEEILSNIEYQKEFSKLDEDSKKYLDVPNLNEKIKLISQIGEYPNVLNSSDYIRKCIEQNKLYQKYRKLNDEYQQIEVPENIEIYTGNFEDIRKLHSYYKEIENVDYQYSSAFIDSEIIRRKNYSLFQNYQKEYETLSTIQIPEENIITEEEYSFLCKKYEDLKTVKFSMKPEYDEFFVEKYIRRIELFKEYSKYSDLWNVNEKDLIETIQKVEKLERLRREMKEYSDFEDFSDMISELKSEIEQKEKIVEGIRLFWEYDDMKRQCDEYILKNNEIVDELTNITTLHRTAVNKLHNLVDSMIESVNATIHDIVSCIFNDPIDVELTTFRELKNKKLNPEISLKINYRGGSFTDIKRLSKGEKCRVVLAVTLALCRISGSKFFLMDEILAHVEQDIKEKIIEVIKKYTSGIISVMISPDIVIGEYDNQIDLAK